MQLSFGESRRRAENENLRRLTSHTDDISELHLDDYVDGDFFLSDFSMCRHTLPSIHISPDDLHDSALMLLLLLYYLNVSLHVDEKVLTVL